MILGAISFCFILYIFVGDPMKNILITLEVSHVYIFLFAIFRSLVVAFTIFISMRLTNHWKKLERMDLIKYLECKEKYRKIDERHDTSSFFTFFLWSIRNPGRFFKYRKLHDVHALHDLR